MNIYKIQICMLVLLVSSSTSPVGSPIDDIDLDFYDRINLQPRCDTVTVSYVSGGSYPIPTICQPYMLRVEVYAGLGEYMETWEDCEEGPKRALQTGVNLAKTKYSLEVAAAQSAATACAGQAAVSYMVNLGFCLTDGILQGSEEYHQCEAAETDAFVSTLEACDALMIRRITNALNEVDHTMDMFVEAYAGCEGLNEMVTVWLDDWDLLIRK